MPPFFKLKRRLVFVVKMSKRQIMGKNSHSMARKQVYCDTCSCYIPSGSLVESHNKGRKHQKLWNMIQKKKKLSRCSVFVRGFRKDSDIENDLELVFSKFGSIADVYVDKEKCSYAIVQFEEEHPVANLLQSKHNLFINGHKLIVKPRKQKEDEPTLQNKGTIVAHEKKYEELLMDERLIDCESTSEQMEKLVEIMQLTAEDLELRHKLCEFLEEIFKEIYINCRVLPFGSTATGLGCHGCDLDITLLTEDLSAYESTKQRKHFEDSNSYREGSGSNTDSAMKSHKELTEVCEILRKFAPGCKNVFPLSGTHCPLVKFEHKDSSLRCDLSINNRLAVRNSQLLSSYCALDIRFRYLSYAIRSWATAKAIAGRGAFQLTKYAWAIMLVHYLQHCDPPVLPCLQKEKTDDADNCFIEGWDCYFDAEPEKGAEKQNSLSLGQLLAGFFHYFMNFNWKSDIVCISIPMKQEKEDFSKHLEKIGKKDLFKDGAIWMPDPFELTHNIAHNMTKKGLENLINELESALDTFVSNDIDCKQNIRCIDTSGHSNSKQNLQNGDDESSVSNTNGTLEGGLIFDSKTIGENKFEQVGLMNLLKPKEIGVHGKKRIHLKVKFVFDVYGYSYESPTVVCRRCASVALKILKHDLNIQCSYRVEAKQDVDPSSTSVSLGSIADCINHSGVNAMLCQKEVSVPKCPEMDSCNMEDSLKESDKRIENEERMKNHERKESSANSDLDLEKNSSELSNLKAITPMKRLGSRDMSERPRKVQHLMEESDGGMGDFNELEIGATFESVELTITAWENTWINRRQQRRMIDSRKGSTTVKTNVVIVENEEVASQLSEASPSYKQNVPNNSFMYRKPFEKNVEKSLESSLNSFVFDTDLQPTVKETLACDTVPGKPVFLAEIRFTVNERSISDPRCRIVVRLIESEKLSEFHTFFAFFKKAILQEMKR